MLGSRDTCDWSAMHSVGVRLAFPVDVAQRTLKKQNGWTFVLLHTGQVRGWHCHRADFNTGYWFHGGRCPVIPCKSLIISRNIRIKQKVRLQT